jgi:hypothetical protein
MDNQFIGQSPDMFALQRKQALADALMQQSMAPNPTQTIGRVAIRQSPLEGLSQLAQAYASQRLQQQAADQQRGVQQQGIQDATKFAAALRGTPAVEAHALPADQQGPTNEAIAAKGPDLAQAMQIAMGSSNPMLNQAGGQLLSAQMSSVLPKAPKWTPIEQYNPQTGMKEKVLIDENNPQNRMPLGGQEAAKMEVSGGNVYNPYTAKPGTVLTPAANPWENLVVPGANGQPTPNQPLIQAKKEIANAGASKQMQLVNAFEPFQNKLQGGMAEKLAGNFENLQNAPATLQALDKAKEYAKNSKFIGSGADIKLEMAKFFNNNFGTNIDPKSVKNTEALQSALFYNVMDNLKKMDASPSQQQQKYLQDAMGRITTDPSALPEIIDFWKGQIQSKVGEHNRRVEESVKSGTKFPYDIRVRMPEQQKAPANTVVDWGSLK